MRKKTIVIVLVILSFFIIDDIFAQEEKSNSSPSVLIIKENIDNYVLGQNVDIHEDKTKKLTIDDVSKESFNSNFKKSNDKVPSFGFKESAYWIRFTVKSEISTNKIWLLELAYPLMDSIELYYRSEGGFKEYTRNTGYTKPFNNRKIKHRNFLFKLGDLDGKTETYYLRFLNEDRMEMPLTLLSTETFLEKDHRDQLILGLYYGMILIIIIYNIIMFITLRDISFIYYTFFLVVYSFFQLTQNGLAYEYIIPDNMSNLLHYIPISITITLLATIQFSQKFLNTASFTPKLDKAMLISKIVFALFLFLSFLISYSGGILVSIVLTTITVVLVLSSGFILLRQKYRPAVYFMLAWTIFLLGAIIYSLKVLAVIPSNIITHYAMQAGSVIQFLLLSFGLGDRIRVLKKEKIITEQELIETQKREVETIDRTSKEIEEASIKLTISEERYRMIIEESADIVFSLDDDYYFLSANKAIKKHLKIDPGTVHTLNFLDLIHDESPEVESAKSVAKNMIMDKLEQLIESGSPIEFIADLSSPKMQQPKEMKVRLESIKVKGKNEILGKATSIVTDSLLKFFVTEKHQYNIDNNLFTAEEITQRLTRNIIKYCKQNEVNVIRVALREMIINAIEHGNLNVTFDEKTKAMEDEGYFNLIAKRQRDPRYSERRVGIEYLVNKEKVVYKISDDGFGFNYNEIMTKDDDELNENFIAHGRGIKIALNTFDEVQYNKKGNIVLLTKYFK